LDALLSEALVALDTALSGLLPSPADASLKPALTVLPVRCLATGLGGYIGINIDPIGQLGGCRLEALAIVTVKAPALADLNGALSDSTRAIVAADQKDLRKSGVQEISLDSLGPTPAQDAVAPFQREVTFRIKFEYLKKPEAGEGVIKVVEQHVSVG
jgi:hypothetical protein